MTTDRACVCGFTNGHQPDCERRNPPKGFWVYGEGSTGFWYWGRDKETFSGRFPSRLEAVAECWKAAEKAL